MLIPLLIIVPFIGIIILCLVKENNKNIKEIGLISTLISLIISLIIFILYNYSNIDYLFLYTLTGSLFLLLAILYILTMLGGTDLDLLFKSNLNYNVQLVLFIGIFIAFAVKTPVIFLNT